MVTREQILRLAEVIAREFRPERIILFGSHADGTAGPDSDVDLLVILPFEGKPWRMAAEILTRVESSLPLDLLARTAEQVRERVQLGDPFVEEITTRGEVLYATDHAGVG